MSCEHDIQDLNSRLHAKLTELDGADLDDALRRIEDDVLAPHRPRLTTGPQVEVATSIPSKRSNLHLDQHSDSNDGSDDGVDPSNGPWPDSGEPDAISGVHTVSSRHSSLQNALSSKSESTVLSHSYVESQPTAAITKPTHESEHQAVEPPLGEEVTDRARDAEVGDIEILDALPKTRSRQREAKLPGESVGTAVRKGKQGDTSRRSATRHNDTGPSSDYGTADPEPPKKKKRLGRPPKAPRQADGKLAAFEKMGATPEQTRKIINDALKKHDVYAIGRIQARVIIETVVEATRKAGGTETQCELVAELFAQMFSKATANRAFSFLVQYNSDLSLAESTRAMHEEGQPDEAQSGDGGEPVAKLTTRSQSYDSFISIAVNCALIGRRHKQDEFVLISLYARLAVMHSKICDELDYDTDAAARFHARADQYKARFNGVKNIRLSDATINAILDFHDMKKSNDDYRTDAEQINRYLTIGNNIRVLSTWGYGMGLLLYGMPWNSILQHLNCDYVKAGLAALVAIDKNVQTLFDRPLTPIFNAVATGQKLHLNLRELERAMVVINNGVNAHPLAIASLPQPTARAYDPPPPYEEDGTPPPFDPVWHR